MRPHADITRPLLDDESAEQTAFRAHESKGVSVAENEKADPDGPAFSFFKA